MKKKREMEMKKQFLKSAAILSLAVTAVSTSQPVGAIVKYNAGNVDVIVDELERYKWNQEISPLYYGNVYNTLQEYISKINYYLTSEDYDEPEFKKIKEELLEKTTKYEKYLVYLSSQNKIKKEKYIGHYSMQEKYRTSGIIFLDAGVYSHILEELKKEDKKFIDATYKEYHTNQELFPYIYYPDSNFEFYDLLNKLRIRSRSIDTIIERHKENNPDEVEILKVMRDSILNIKINKKGQINRWYLEILNLRMGARKLKELDDLIDTFFEDINEERPKTLPRRTEFNKYLKDDMKKVEGEESTKKIEKKIRLDKNITRSKAGYSLIEEELESELGKIVQTAKRLLEKVNKFRQQDYFKNDYVKVLDYKQQLVEGLTSCERIIKTLETDKPTPEHIIKEKVLHLAKITEDVNDFMNGLKTKKELNKLKSLTNIPHDISISYKLDAPKVYGELVSGTSTPLSMLFISKEPITSQSFYTITQATSMRPLAQKIKEEVVDIRSTNDSKKQKVEQEKTKSPTPQKEAIKEQTEQKISGKTQNVEKKSETVATPQQSSAAQTSVQQPAPVQPVVQESKASQEEINAAHDAISAYKSTVNIANTAGVTTAEMTTLINTQTSNLSDVEKALGNNKVNNGAVNVLREDTARLENMIWNRAYQAIEEFNVARNTYNNQIKTETVPVDNDIEAILAGSQANISHLDNRIGARHMDQAFVASLLEVTEMSKSISSRIKE